MLCLKVATDPRWAEHAARNVDAVLVDHAHCEMKAASNALSLAARHPKDLDLVRALTDLAREELEHFQQVLDLLDARGLALGPPSVDTYAAELRKASADRWSLTATGGKLADRLVVGAVIEARSCERFKLLARTIGAREGGGDRALAAFYTELFVAEARHYQFLIDLAIRVSGGGPAATQAIHERLEVLAEREAAIVRGLSSGTGASASPSPTIHG
jgi:tRNA-(ms[2]io[6]A)-hydroxylase